VPKVEIGHVYGIYIRAEANEASYSELFAAARAEFEHAVKTVEGIPTGPANGVQTERRGEPRMGFGTHWAQPGRWIGTTEVAD
jgi:hypothetical protein